MHYNLVVQSIHSESFTLEHLAARADMHPEIVERLVECGLLQPLKPLGAVFRFEADAVPRLHSIQRLRSDLGINLQGVAVILDLVARLRDLEYENASLRARF